MLLEARNLCIGIRRGGGASSASRGGGFLSAVEDISFSVDSGEITGLVGESGCGKTLTGLSIPGLLPRGAEITEGRIVFNGNVISGLSEKEFCSIRGKEIAMIFQEPLSSLNPLQRVKRQIAEPLLLHGERNKSRMRKRSLEIMEALGLQEPETLLEMYPHQLSGGICQRVMIALAVIGEPRLLIADEPTTALDADTGAQILDLLERINKTLGTSILFISHDLRLVRRFCSRVLVMYAGKLVEEGPGEELFSNPLHEYTKGLVGAIPGKEMRGRPLARIPGRVPPLEEGRPPGCPFAPRCARALPECAASFPEARSRNGRIVRCLRAEIPGGAS